MNANWKSCLSLEERERIAYAEGDLELSRLLCTAIDGQSATSNTEDDTDFEEEYTNALGALQDISDIVSHYV